MQAVDVRIPAEKCLSRDVYWRMERTLVKYLHTSYIFKHAIFKWSNHREPIHFLSITWKMLYGTVRPDWICMRVVPLPLPLDRPWKGHQPLICFWFFNFCFEYLKRLQSSKPLHTKMNPTSCLYSLYRILLPIGCHTFICRKNLPKVCSILVRIAGCWFSSNILLINCWLSRIFGARFGRKDYGLCPTAHTTRDPNK